VTYPKMCCYNSRAPEQASAVLSHPKKKNLDLKDSLRWVWNEFIWWIWNSNYIDNYDISLKHLSGLCPISDGGSHHPCKPHV
jgi:hypothetical protein